MKNLLEVFKANKKSIIVKSLIIGGVIAGLKVVEIMMRSKNEDGEVVENNEVVEEASNEISSEV